MQFPVAGLVSSSVVQNCFQNCFSSSHKMCFPLSGAVLVGPFPGVTAHENAQDTD
jgi:hypothetical protein